MTTITSISKVGVRLLLTVLFLFAGANKVTDLISPEMNAEMAKKFICYGSWTGKPEYWQLAVGAMEIFFALFLWLSPGIGSLALLVIMGGAVGSHLMCDPEGAVNPLFPAGLLVLHLLLVRLTRKPDAKKKKQ